MAGIELLPFVSRQAGSGLVSRPRQLIFAHDPFVTIGLALHPVLENAGVFGQQTDHFELPAGRAELVAVGRKADGLSNSKLRRLHH